MEFFEVVIFSGFEGPIAGSLESDNREFGPISGFRRPDSSLYCGGWCVAKGDCFLWSLFLDWFVGVLVISEWGHFVVRGDISEH